MPGRGWPRSPPGSAVLLTLLLLAPLFSDLPKPVLAAIIIEAVVMGMMDLPEMRRLFRVKRFDFGVAVAALLGALVFGVLAGVIIGVALSIFWLIKVSTRPHIPTLAREPGTDVYRDLSDHPDGELVPGIVVIRMDGGLFFATSDALEDRVREVIHSDPGVFGIVLDCGGIDFIDSQGSAKMADVLDLAEDSDVVLRLARLKAAVRATLELDGVMDRLGADHVHGNIARAVQAELPDATGTPPAARPDALPDAPEVAVRSRFGRVPADRRGWPAWRLTPERAMTGSSRGCRPCVLPSRTPPSRSTCPARGGPARAHAAC